MAGPELVRKLMRRLGLVSCQPRPWRPVTTAVAAYLADRLAPGLSRAYPLAAAQLAHREL